MKKLLSILVLIGFLTINQGAFAVETIYSLDEEGVNSEHTDVINQNEIQNSSVLQASITFDWLDITQAQREENISKYKNLLFENNSSKIYYEQDQFKKQYAKYFKDHDFKTHYMYANNGVTEDEEAKYCAFYYKNKTLMIYAIQYKDNPRQAFYYSPFGKMYYTDLMSDEYPNFPYTSMQYDRKGRLSSAIYFISKDIQYMFGPDKEFQGIWYKDKMYDKNGKQTITRTHW